MSTLLQRRGQERKEALDLRCPLFHHFYTEHEARSFLKENVDWNVLYGKESILAAIRLAKTRDCGHYLRGEDAKRWLSHNYPLHRHSKKDKRLLEAYFTDPLGVEKEKRVYDMKGNCFLQSHLIREAVALAMEPLRRDIVAYFNGTRLLSFLPSAGSEEVIVPLGTEVLFFGPYKYDEEEILLHPDARIENGRVFSPFMLEGRFLLQEERSGISFKEFQ
jgi:hypothetical protein